MTLRLFCSLRRLSSPVSLRVSPGCQQRVYIVHLSQSQSVRNKLNKELFSISREGSKPILTYFSNQKTTRLQVKMASKIRQNFHEDSEALINKQINMEMYASFVYLSMVRILFFFKLFMNLVILFKHIVL